MSTKELELEILALIRTRNDTDLSDVLDTSEFTILELLAGALGVAQAFMESYADAVGKSFDDVVQFHVTSCTGKDGE